MGGMGSQQQGGSASSTAPAPGGNANAAGAGAGAMGGKGGKMELVTYLKGQGKTKEQVVQILG